MDQYIQAAIKNRRSIRDFTEEPVSLDSLHRIIQAGIWAPSGLNNQPWRFVTILDRAMQREIAALTKYSHIVKAAPALIAVYLDQEKMYDPVKDHQAAGACIQNMLLTVEELGLGAVWLGQILTNKEQVNNILQLDVQYDLMALLAIGRPAHRNQKSRRQPLEDFILHEFGGNTL